MKQLIWLTLSVFFLTTLSGCVGASSKTVRVKCPACGYEFDVDTSGH